MANTPVRLRSRPTFLVTQVALHARRLVTDAFTRAGARGYHYRVLATLEEHGPLSQADLGRSVNMDRSDVVAALDQLAELGQVERRPDPDDARRKIVHLTAAGRRQLRRLDREVTEAQEQFVAPLDDDERATLQRLLERLLDHHDATTPTGRSD